MQERIPIVAVIVPGPEYAIYAARGIPVPVCVVSLVHLPIAVVVHAVATFGRARKHSRVPIITIPELLRDPVPVFVPVISGLGDWATSDAEDQCGDQGDRSPCGAVRMVCEGCGIHGSPVYNGVGVDARDGWQRTCR